MNRELAASAAGLTKSENGRVLIEQLHIQQIELQLQNEELLRVQAELEVSRARYFDLYNLAPVGYITLDKQGRITQANLRAASLLGTNNLKLDKRMFSEFVSGSEADTYYLARRQLLNTGEPQVCELRLRRAGEPHFWGLLEMSLSTVRGSDEGLEQSCRIVIMDISERKVAQQSFDAFMNHNPFGAAIIDQDGRYLDVNPAMAQYTGRSKDAWIGKTFSDVWPPGVWESLKRRHAYVVATQQPITETETFPVGGERRVQQLVHFPFDGPKGKKLVGCISFDITDRFRLETALREANAHLERDRELANETTRAKTQFLSAMSHEIRTPLNGVIGMAGLLLYTPLTGEQLGHVRVIVDSAELLLSLVDNILDISKIEAGKMELEHASFELETVIEDILCLLSFKAHEKSLELACWYPADAPRHFVGDAIRLRQVLTNLISNAVKFTEVGHVLVEVDASEPVDGECMVRISVHDTGIGVSPKKQSTLFDSYTQADLTINKRFGGTGLGLSIVKQIVELMKGTVSVNSAEGQGSVFCCSIPLAVESEPPNAAVHLNGRILISGARPLGRFVTSEWCERWGMTVEQCDAEDLSYLINEASEQGTPFEIVILEGSLNKAVEALSKIRLATQGSAAPKVVIVSSDLPAKTKAVGADAVLFTPVRSKILWQTLSELLVGQAEEAIVEIVPPPAVIPPPEKRICRVLVTDDNVINQRLAGALLARMGCQVDIADSGFAAIEKIRRVEYDVVFMDCVMPGMNGFETTAAIRNLVEIRRRVPIVALTASATNEDREQCFAAGMDDFLSKPIRSEQLQECLSRWTSIDQA